VINDARDPGARAKSLQCEIARHLQKEVANKEDARAKTIDFWIDANRLVHLQRGKADVDPIDVADEISEQQKRHQAP